MLLSPSAVGHLTHNPSAKGKYCLSKPRTGRKYVFIRPFQINAGCSCHSEYETGSKMNKHADASETNFPSSPKKGEERKLEVALKMLLHKK